MAFNAKSFRALFLRITVVSLVIFGLLFANGAINAQAQAITEGFENVPAIFNNGWVQTNNSMPLGALGWFQCQPSQGGGPSIPPAQAGTSNSCISVNFQSTGDLGTISNWLIAPTVTLRNGDTFSFYTKTVSNTFPDRLQVRLSTNGSSTNVGATATSVGDFTNLLLDIDPNYAGTYPLNWTQFTVTVSGLSGPTSGRLAFRYFVENAGAQGVNSNIIGIDTFVYTPIPVAPQPPPVDFDGDGKSDYSIVRDNTPPGTTNQLAPAGRRSISELQSDPGFKPLQPVGNAAVPVNHGTNLGWYINNSVSNTSTIVGFGQPATDFWVPEDYDGDGKDDIAVWRGVAASGPNGGFFYTFTSSNNTVNEINFGLLGDNPTVVGDYDGDGIADPAVFRQPGEAPFGQTFFFFKGSNNNPNGNITYVQWGNNVDEDLRPYPGDFDGDGKFDFCIFRTNPNNSNQGQYVLLKSSNGGIEYINWGLNPQNEPVLAPGDYDGDSRTDFMNVRVNGSTIQWWLLTRNGNQSTTNWGSAFPANGPFSEFIAQGDFDGDGSTDIGIWRRDNNSNSNSFFYTLRSSNRMLQAFEWGSSNDAPVPGWNAN